MNTAKGATLWQIFEKTVQAFPSKIAVEDEFNRNWTYAELHDTVKAFATKFELGSSRNPFVVSLVSGGIKYIVSSLATLYVNKIVVVLHDNYTGAQVQKCLKMLNFPPVVTTQVKWDTLNIELGHAYPHLHFFQDNLEWMSCAGIPSSPKLTNNDAEEMHDQNTEAFEGVAYCIFTSGSTGTPKAVLVRDSSVVAGGMAIVETDPETFTSDVRTTMGVSIGFILSLCELWLVFLSGGTLVIPVPEMKLDIDRYRSWITERGITATAFPTPLLELLMAKDVDKMTTLRYVIVGGARLNPQRIRMDEANFTVYNIYGATETCLTTMCKISRGKVVTTSVGKPAKGVLVYIVDEQGQKVTDPDVVGNICVAGEGVMHSYYGQPELTAQVFTPNPFDPNVNPLYKTGDCGYWSKDGELFVTGREDDQVKVHGIRLELGEIESALSSFPGIRQVIVLAYSASGYDANKQICAFYTMHQGGIEPERPILDAFLFERLQRHAIPRSIIFLDKMPLLSSGKIDRVKLKGILTNRRHSIQDPSNHVALLPKQDEPLSDWLLTVRSVWAEVLKLDPEEIEINDNFFYIGGNSVLMFIVLEKLSKLEPKIQDTSPLLLVKVPVLKDFAHALSPSKVTKGVQEAATIDFNAEIQLPEDFEAPSQQTAILITGTTGFLGPLLLMDALKAYEDAEIFTIIRAPNDDAANTRLMNTLNSNDCRQFVIGIERVHCLAGDLTKPNFGLDKVTYEKLAQQVKVILHSAAEVSFMKSYEQLRETTVEMTKSILQFAIKGVAKQVHFMSTVGVFDSIVDPSSAIYEAAEDRIPPEVNPSNMMNAYEQSKWVSEQLVWGAVERGLVAYIYRIGQIGAHTITKAVNRSDAIAGFLVTCKKLQKYPWVNLRLPFVDANVSETIVELSKLPPAQPRCWARVFHLVGGEVGFQGFFEGDDTVCPVTLAEWEAEFLTSVNQSPKTQDEVNAWLSLQMLKHDEGQQETENHKKSMMKNISFSVQQTVKAGGHKFRKVNARLYVDLLWKAARN